jgi:hypothetical protein
MSDSANSQPTNQSTNQPTTPPIPLFPPLFSTRPPLFLPLHDVRIKCAYRTIFVLQTRPPLQPTPQISPPFSLSSVISTLYFLHKHRVTHQPPRSSPLMSLTLNLEKPPVSSFSQTLHVCPPPSPQVYVFKRFLLISSLPCISLLWCLVVGSQIRVDTCPGSSPEPV